MNAKLPSAEPRIMAIPLGSLSLAAANVRKTVADDAAFTELKSSIAAHGLLENLIVCPDRDQGPERFSVVAGGRRLTALGQLAAEGAIDAYSPIPCLVVDADAPAAEISLAENVIRVAMHPADQVEAFAVLAENGSTVSGIAARFGVSERAVEQRLRLGNAAPELIDAYRADEMDLQSLQAFAVTTDHARQLAAWKQIAAQGYRPNSWQIKRLLTDDRIPCGAAVAMFVGVDAYEAAGGAVDRDLFASEEEGGTWFNDPVLLDKLATDRLTAVSNELARTWKWADARVEAPWNALAAFGRVHSIPAPPTKAEDDELASLKTRHDEIAETDDDYMTEDLIAEAETIEERIDEIEAGIEARATFTPEDMAISGCIATIGRDGTLQVVSGLVRPEDIPAPATATGDVPAGTATAASGPGAAPTVQTPAITGPSITGDPAAEARKRAGVGIGLADDLRAIRTTEVKVHLAEDFPAAFDLTLFQMARAVFIEGYVDHALDIAIRKTPDRPAIRMNDDEFATANPGEAVLEDLSALRFDWMAIDDRNDSFAALCALPDTDKQRLFAACAARTLKGQLAFEHGAKPEVEATVARLDIDFAKRIRPTADIYWSRIRKSDILDVARETLGVEWAASFSKHKKPALASAMEKAFATEGERALGVTEEMHAVAAAWALPGFRAFDTGTVDDGGNGNDEHTAEPDADPASPPADETHPGPAPSVVESIESPGVADRTGAARNATAAAEADPPASVDAQPVTGAPPSAEPGAPRVMIDPLAVETPADENHAASAPATPPPVHANGHDANDEAFDIPEFLRRT